MRRPTLVLVVLVIALTAPCSSHAADGPLAGLGSSLAQHTQLVPPPPAPDEEASSAAPDPSAADEASPVALVQSVATPAIQAVGEAAEPAVGTIRPLASAAAPLVSSVTDGLAPVTQVAAPALEAVKPLADAAAPLVGSVSTLVRPILGEPRLPGAASEATGDATHADVPAAPRDMTRSEPSIAHGLSTLPASTPPTPDHRPAPATEPAGAGAPNVAQSPVTAPVPLASSRPAQLLAALDAEVWIDPGPALGQTLADGPASPSHAGDRSAAPRRGAPTGTPASPIRSRLGLSPAPGVSALLCVVLAGFALVVLIRRSDRIVSRITILRTPLLVSPLERPG